MGQGGAFLGGRILRLPVALLWLPAAILLGDRALRNRTESDFWLFWNAGLAAANHAPLYHGDAAWHGGYLYAPIFSVLFQPFVWLPIEWAYSAWVATSLAALILSAVLLERAIALRPELKVFPGFGLVALGILSVPVASDFRWANTNSFMMLLITVAFASLMARRQRWAGLALSLAVSIKLVPVAFLAWIVLRRDWRTLVAFCAGSILWLAVIPAIAFGPKYAFEQTQHWVEVVVHPSVEGETLRDAYDSLPRIAGRLFATDPSGAEASGPTPAGLTLAGVVGWSAAGAVLVVTAVCAARESGVGAVSFGLTSVAMLLASPASRSAHFMQIYPLVGLLLAYAVTAGHVFSRRARAGLASAAGCMLVLFALARFFDVTSKVFSPVAGLSLVLWGTGVLLVLGAGWRARDSEPPN